jgi:hypothetical protein
VKPSCPPQEDVSILDVALAIILLPNGAVFCWWCMPPIPGDKSRFHKQHWFTIAPHCPWPQRSRLLSELASGQRAQQFGRAAEVTLHPPAGLPQPRRREAARSGLCALSVHNPLAAEGPARVRMESIGIAGHPLRLGAG